jgi:endonuclease-3
MTPADKWNVISPVLLKRYKRDATFLDFKNPFELLIAVILSAQTTDDGVNKITPVLFKKYPTPKKLATAPLADLEKILHPVGYYRAKARYIKRTAEIVVKEFKSVVPPDETKLRTLPGVGRKTAVAVLSNAFGMNIGIPVDTHVIRFVKRFGISKSKNPDVIERELLEIIPKKDWRRAGYAIKEYGRKEGKARPYNPNVDPVMQALKKYE